MAYSSLIGARVKRKEDPRLITGAGAYVGDLKLPGMQHVVFVRSPYAHARIRGIDAEAARRHLGVLAVVTGKELAALCDPMPIGGGGEGGSSDDGEAVPGLTHHALSTERVRHVGEAVAAVIASTPEIAVDAAAEVVVDWDPLPAVGDMFKALEPGAPKVFDQLESNVEHIWQRKRGEPETAFASAHRVVGGDRSWSRARPANKPTPRACAVGTRRRVAAGVAHCGTAQPNPAPTTGCGRGGVSGRWFDRGWCVGG